MHSVDKRVFKRVVCGREVLHVRPSSAAEILSAGVIARVAQTSASLGTGLSLGVRVRVRHSKSAGGEQGDGRDDCSVLHFDLDRRWS